jgi:hypothetical protein
MYLLLRSCFIEWDPPSNNYFVMLPQRHSRITDNEFHAFYVLRIPYIFINKPSKVRGTK